MKLSILDQSPVIGGHDARRAIEETLALARRAEELGYYRYWLAEHHAIAALADPCPEVLVARLGAETRRHAHRHRRRPAALLQRLPHRGGVSHAGGALSRAHRPGHRARAGRRRAHRAGGRRRRVSGRRAVSAAGVGARRPPRRHAARRPSFKRVRLQPEVPTAPEVWLLGSSDYSGALAAQLGMAFAFAHFINPRGGDEVTRAYREHFRPGHGKAPRAMVCTFLICAEADEEAERLAAADRPAAAAHGAQYRLARAHRPRRRAATSTPPRSASMSPGSAPARSSAARGRAATSSRRWRALRRRRGDGADHHRRLRLAHAVLRAANRGVLVGGAF